MALDGRSEPLAVLTRWALPDSPSARPQSIWFVWRYSTWGGVLEGILVIPYKGRSVRCTYVTLRFSSNRENKYLKDAKIMALVGVSHKRVYESNKLSKKSNRITGIKTNPQI